MCVCVCVCVYNICIKMYKYIQSMLFRQTETHVCARCGNCKCREGRRIHFITKQGLHNHRR